MIWTDLFKIISNFRMNFEVNFGIDFKIDFELDFGFFVLDFLELRFYKYFVKKKKICALHAQIGTVLFKLINQKYCFFNFAFYLTI